MKRRVQLNYSMLEGPIWKGLTAFAIPIFLGNLFQQFYNTADSLIVGNFLGKEALAAVTSSTSLITMMVSLLQGIALGAGVLISKYFGARDQEKLQKLIHTDLAFSVAGGLLLTLVGCTLAPTILGLMDTPAEIMPDAVAYFRTYFLGSVASFLYNVSTGILQSVGDSRHPLYYLILSAVINVVLDLLFVAVLHLGVGSAAAATALSQVVAAVLCLRQLSKADPLYRVDLRKLRFHLPSLGMIFRFGIPAGVQTSVTSIANVIVQRYINGFGADAIAGCGAYSRPEGFAFLPVTCFAMGVATFVGQNIGARQYDRVKAGARFGTACCVILSGLVGLGIYLFAPQLIALFNRDPNVIAIGVHRAHVVAPFYALMALSHCISGILRGAGRPNASMSVMLICWCLIRVAFVAALTPICQDIAVVFWAYPITWLLSSIVYIVYYYKADWLHTYEKQEQRQAAQ